jgi:hypothetical protein
MSGFDFLIQAILTSVGGALLLAKGYGQAACDETLSARRKDVRHTHMMAGTRWLAIGGLAFLLAVTRGRDTLFLVEHWENVLVPCLVLTTAWVITSARADRAGREPAVAGGDDRQVGKD